MPRKTIAIIAALIIVSALAPAVALGAKADAKDVTFNFVDVELPAITKFISDITGKNFIYDERLRGKITIISPSKLGMDEAFDLYTSVLKLKGFTLSPAGVNAYRIIPSLEARQFGLDVSDKATPVNEGYAVRLAPLKHINADEAIRFVQPLISKDGFITSFGPGNLLMIVDSGLNMQKILNIIETIDVTHTSEEPEIIYLKHASAEQIADVINQGASGATGVRRPPGAQPSAAPGAASAVVDKRLNALILIGDPGQRESMKRLIALLDVPSETTRGMINVYFLENADADELAKVIAGIIGAPAAKAAPAGGGPSPQVFQSASGISITPDPATNALVIVASPADYGSLVAVIKQLDKRRKQVFVEAMIVEASIDKLLDLGTSWRAVATKDGEPVLVGGVGQINRQTMSGIASGMAGMTIGGMGNFMEVPVTDPDSGNTTKMTIPGFAALFRLSDFSGAVNVLSTPQLLTSDNKEAEILVGENVPFISRSEKTAGSDSVFNTIERKDVGIMLKLTPQITEGDYVKLTIYQEISSVKETKETAILTTVGPSTTKRSTSTTVIVKNEETVVIGGLMQDKRAEVEYKVPLLGDIPILGWLFKQRSVSNEKTNLLVFLTPHVIGEGEDLAKLTDKKQLEFATKADQFAPDEIYVGFAEGVAPEKALAVIVTEEARVVEFDEETGLYLVKFEDGGDDLDDMLNDFLDYDEVVYAAPHYVMSQ